VRHDLPHMPSLGVSSLDSRPLWRHGGLLFAVYVLGKVTVEHAEDEGDPSLATKCRGCSSPLLWVVAPDKRCPAEPILPTRFPFVADALAETVILRAIPGDERCGLAGSRFRYLWSMRCAIANSAETPRRCPIDFDFDSWGGASEKIRAPDPRFAAERHRVMEYFSPVGLRFLARSGMAFAMMSRRRGAVGPIDESCYARRCPRRPTDRLSW
jgi:hypothetical protein